MTWLVALVALLFVVVVVIAIINHESGNIEGGVIPASYPEGPLYQGKTLYYTAMRADTVSVVKGNTSRPFFVQAGCGPTAIAPYKDGFVVLCHIGQRIVQVTSHGKDVRSWTSDSAGSALKDPNDAYADDKGGVYFSDPGLFSRNSAPEGRVMYLSADGVITKVLDGLWYPNGVYVDGPRHRLLVDEHLRGKVLSYPIEADGALGPATVFASLTDVPASSRYTTPYAETGFDGLEMGPNGDVYVAIYGDGRIVRFDTNGHFRGEITLPTRYVTNISFAPNGSAVTTGSFDNAAPPYAGEVRFHTAAELTK